MKSFHEHLRSRAVAHAFIITLASTIAASCKVHIDPASSSKEGFNKKNDGTKLITSRWPISRLSDESMRRGSHPFVPWSSSFWPIRSMGLAQRWIGARPAFSFQTKVGDPKTFLPKISAEIDHTITSLQSNFQAPWQDTVDLSPAEKYDIAVGDRSFSTTRFELRRYAQYYGNNGDSAWSWMGHCHGWAPASLVYVPPRRGVLAINPVSRTEALFTEGDIRGLLAKAAADSGWRDNEAAHHFFGDRCRRDDARYDHDRLTRSLFSECRDINPGAMHIMLTTFLADGTASLRASGKIPRVGLILERERWREVWNQPIIGFETRMGKPTPLRVGDAEGTATDPLISVRAPGTTHIVDVYTSITYGDDSMGAMITTPSDWDLKYSHSMDLHYTLELNGEDGTIIGGEWASWPSNIGQSDQPRSGAELLRSLPLTPVDDADYPDFIFAVDMNARLAPGGIVSNDFAEWLHQCSLARGAPTETLTILDRDGIPREASYSRCVLPNNVSSRGPSRDYLVTLPSGSLKCTLANGRVEEVKSFWINFRDNAKPTAQFELRYLPIFRYNNSPRVEIDPSLIPHPVMKLIRADQPLSAIDSWRLFNTIFVGRDMGAWTLSQCGGAN